MKSFFKVRQSTFYFLHEIKALLNDFVQIHLLLPAFYLFMRTALLSLDGSAYPLEVA